MKKKLLQLILLMMTIVCAGSSAFAQTPRVLINGEPLAFTDAEPFIEEGRTLVPLRAVFEALNASVQWSEEDQTVFFVRAAAGGMMGGALQINNTTAFAKTAANAQTKPITLEVPARIVNDRTFVPLRFVAEALGERVTWDQESYTVTISSSVIR